MVLIGWVVKWMVEMIGFLVSIIYWLFGLMGCEDGFEEFSKELDGGFLIIDEMLMVDMVLF